MGLYEVGRADRGGHQEGPGRTVLGHALPGAKRRVAEDLPLEDASHSGVMGGLAQRRGKLGGALCPVGHPRAAAVHLDAEQPLVHIGVPERVVGHAT